MKIALSVFVAHQLFLCKEFAVLPYVDMCNLFRSGFIIHTAHAEFDIVLVRKFVAGMVRLDLEEPVKIRETHRAKPLIVVLFVAACCRIAEVKDYAVIVRKLDGDE